MPDSSQADGSRRSVRWKIGQEQGQQAQDRQGRDEQQADQQERADPGCVDDPGQDGRVEVGVRAAEHEVGPHHGRHGEELEAGTEGSAGDELLGHGSQRREGAEEDEQGAASSAQGQGCHGCEGGPSQDEGQGRALRAGRRDTATTTRTTGPRREPAPACTSSTIA